MSINILSARAIASRVDLPVAERRALLEMLGLVAIGGREVLPDDIRAVDPPTIDNNQRISAAKNPEDERLLSRHSVAPAGLRASRGAARDTWS